VAVVTGGAGALGGAIVAGLAATGHAVLSLDIATRASAGSSSWCRTRSGSPAEDILAYVASKGEPLIALARTLAVGHGADGTAVTCAAPGLTDTPAARRGVPASAFGDVRSRQVLPRTLLPSDVAAMVAFVASDGAAALTGQAICVDGGLVLR
jgi:NAD(P)-dependent dehydrogenase (short-subunit alcohol dehydrogenase family)